MKKTILHCGDRNAVIYHTDPAEYILLQPSEPDDLSSMDEEAETIKNGTAAPFLLAAVPTRDWFGELSPWPAPAVFGKQAFLGRGQAFLALLKSTVLPEIYKEMPVKENTPLIVGGYSLAGLFALWAGYEWDKVRSVAAASPSVWFPGWMAYAEKNEIQARSVYLSLGDREEKTKNAVMASVGDNIRQMHSMLSALPDMETDLIWNQGNHFQDAPGRTARAFLWAMEHTR